MIFFPPNWYDTSWNMTNLYKKSLPSRMEKIGKSTQNTVVALQIVWLTMRFFLRKD